MFNISKIWLTDTGVWIRTADGREACEPFSRIRGCCMQARKREQTINVPHLVFIGH